MLPSLKRWIDLSLMTFVAFLFWVLFYPLLESATHHFTLLLDPLPVWMRFPTISLLVGFVWCMLIRLGGFRFSDIFPSILLRYPPVWLFGIIGTIFYLWFISDYHNDSFNSVGLGNLGIDIGSIVLGMVIAGLWNFYRPTHGKTYPQRPKENMRRVNNFNSIIENPEKLFQWIEQELPIDNPSKDLFGFTPIAKKIVSILIQQTTRTIGVVGPYGSGKSSLLNLVEYYLSAYRDTCHSNPPHTKSNDSSERIFTGKMLVCRIDGWGRSKGSIAQQILTIAVRRLSLEIDCLSIITVPARYRESFTGFKSPWATIISALLGPDEDPIRILERIDMILRATNMRLIIFLEDVDRNVSDAMIRDEMPSLLDRLHYLNNISFILAIGTEQHYSSILIRICEHVESIS